MNLPPLDLTHPEVARDPYAVYRRYRQAGPTHYQPPSESSPVGRHFLLRHADVVEGLQHPRLVRAGRQSLWDETKRKIPPEHLAYARVFREFPLFKDPPEHAYLRRPINHMLKNVTTPGFRDWAGAEAVALAESLPETGTVDVVESYTVVLVSQLIGTLLGAGDDYTHHQMDEAATFIQMVLSNRGDPQRIAEGSTRIAQMELAIQRRMEEPPGSRPDALLLESVLREAGVAGLPPHQIRSTAIFLLMAARDNVRSAIGTAVHCFLRHPGTWQELRENPGLIPRAVEEVLRYEPIVHFTSRHAAETIEFHGIRIAAGEGVTFALASANRDPDVYANPEQFDMHRAAGPTAAFGFGIHRCPGIALARMMIEEGLRALLARWPEPRLEVPPDQMKWMSSVIFRNLRSLPVRVR